MAENAMSTLWWTHKKRGIGFHPFPKKDQSPRSGSLAISREDLWGIYIDSHGTFRGVRVIFGYFCWLTRIVDCCFITFFIVLVKPSFFFEATPNYTIKIFISSILTLWRQMYRSRISSFWVLIKTNMNVCNSWKKSPFEITLVQSNCVCILA